MAPVHRACGRSDDTAKGNSRRKRRRRCKGREHSNMLPAIISTTRRWDSGTSSVEDAENSSTSSVESRDSKNPTDCDLLRKYCPSRFYTAFPVPKKRAVNRKQDRKKLLFHLSRSACRRASWMVTQKNALVQLNELRPGLQYDVISKTGPLHAPVFSVGVEVNGFHFEGQGPTKKQAKMRAAELALHSFVQFPNASQAQASIGNFSNVHTDFTGDKLDLPDPFLRDFGPSVHENYDTLPSSAAKNKAFPNSYNHRQLVQLTLDLASSAKSKRQTLSIPSEEHLSPVVLLNMLRPGLRYICQTERIHGRPARSFVMVVRVEGRVFEGCGHSKRLAKVQSAAAALQAIYNISLGPEKIMTDLQSSTTQNQLPQFFAEAVFHLVREKYTELANSCSSTSHARHKVLAGIVMTTGFDLRSAQVVSLATGTKCLDTNSVSDRSVTLGDCHAEVIARRALLRFLYAQIELLLRNPADCLEQSIFRPSKTSNGHKVFQLRDGIHFHMYVSSSPCGDTRLNCPYETTAACPGQRFRCHLRVKVNGGEGTLPITAQRIHPTWDRAAPSKRLVTVSCTDKMAKWSVVGLQGALLSHLVEPVYLHSLTVGTLCHTGHLGRTLARRIAPVKHLPFPYRRRQLLLSCLSNSQVRPAGKAPNVSVNWTCGDGGLEEISTSTGRRKESGMPSRLCRRSMFVCWHRLQQQLNGAEISPGTYFSSKMASGCYQRAMQQFTTALQTCGLGTWLRKPPELNDFHISTT